MTGDMDPEARLAWQDVADDELDLSVEDVVSAAQAVAETSAFGDDPRYDAGRREGALAVARSLINSPETNTDADTDTDTNTKP